MASSKQGSPVRQRAALAMGSSAGIPKGDSKPRFAFGGPVKRPGQGLATAAAKVPAVAAPKIAAAAKPSPIDTRGFQRYGSGFRRTKG